MLRAERRPYGTVRCSYPTLSRHVPEETTRRIHCHRLRTDSVRKVLPRPRRLFGPLECPLANPLQNDRLARLPYRTENRRHASANVNAGVSKDVDPVVVRDDPIGKAASGRRDCDLRSGPGCTVVGRKDVAHGRGGNAGRSVSPSDVQSAARGHPYLVMVAYDVRIGAENLISGQELQALPS